MSVRWSGSLRWVRRVVPVAALLALSLGLPVGPSIPAQGKVRLVHARTPALLPLSRRLPVLPKVNLVASRKDKPPRLLGPGSSLEQSLLDAGARPGTAPQGGTTVSEDFPQDSAT